MDVTSSTNNGDDNSLSTIAEEEELSLGSSEALETSLFGAQIVNTVVENVTSPFIVSNRKLGGYPIENSNSRNNTLPDRHPWHTAVPDELLAGLHQLHNFLRTASNVVINHTTCCEEQLKEKTLQTRLKLNRHQNTLTLVTSVFEDFNTKVLTIMRTADVSTYVHNHIRDINACAGAFDRYMEFLRKLGEDVKAEYVLFERSFNMMNGTVEENLTRTFNNVQNSLVALYGRMETVRTLVEQLNTKHEILMNRRRSW